MLKKKITKTLFALAISLAVFGVSDVTLEQFNLPGILIVFACDETDGAGGQCYNKE